jgi:hypothetical protein
MPIGKSTLRNPVFRIHAEKLHVACTGVTWVHAVCSETFLKTFSINETFLKRFWGVQKQKLWVSETFRRRFRMKFAVDLDTHEGVLNYFQKRVLKRFWTGFVIYRSITKVSRSVSERLSLSAWTRVSKSSEKRSEIFQNMILNSFDKNSGNFFQKFFQKRVLKIHFFKVQNKFRRKISESCSKILSKHSSEGFFQTFKISFGRTALTLFQKRFWSLSEICLRKGSELTACTFVTPCMWLDVRGKSNSFGKPLILYELPGQNPYW